MDSKRPDVSVDDRSDEDGRVSALADGNDESDRSLLRRLLTLLRSR